MLNPNLFTGGFFSDALVETMEGVPSIVSMFTMSIAIVYQGDQHPRRPIKTTFYHNSKNAEAKRTTSIAQDTRSLSTKDDSSLPHLERTDNVCTVPTVAVADTGVTISHASDTAKSNVHCTHEAPPEYTPSVSPQMAIEDVQRYWIWRRIMMFSVVICHSKIGLEVCQRFIGTFCTAYMAYTQCTWTGQAHNAK